MKPFPALAAILVIACVPPAAALPDPALVRVVFAGPSAGPSADPSAGAEKPVLRPRARPARPAPVSSFPGTPGFESRLARIAEMLDCLAAHPPGTAC